MGVPANCTLCDQVDVVVYWGVLPACGAFGLIGNILILIIFIPGCFGLLVKGSGNVRQTQTPERPFLIAMATNDLLLITSSVLMFVSVSLDNHNGLRQFVFMIYPFLVGVSVFTFTYHVWARLAVTIDRFLAICVPFWHRTRRPSSFPLILLLSSVFPSLCFAVPRVFEVDVLYNGSYGIEPTEMFLNRDYRLYHGVVAKLVLSSFLPLVTLLGLTIAMVIALHKSAVGKPSQSEPDVSSCSLKILDVGKMSPAETLTLMPQSRSKSAVVRYMNLRYTTVQSDVINRLRQSKRNNSFHEISPLRDGDQSRKISIRRQKNKTLEKQAKSKSTLQAQLKALEQKKRCKRNRAYRPLIAVLMVSIICFTPPSALNMFQVVTSELNMTQLVHIISRVNNILVILAAGSNFYLFVVFSVNVRRSFEQICLSILVCCRLREPQVQKSHKQFPVVRLAPIRKTPMNTVDIEDPISLAPETSAL